MLADVFFYISVKRKRSNRSEYEIHSFINVKSYCYSESDYRFQILEESFLKISAVYNVRAPDMTHFYT